MNSIVKYNCNELGNAEISCLLVDGEPWFKAIDVAKVLKYVDTDKAIRMHVCNDDKREQCTFNLDPAKLAGLSGNWKNTKFINESGLYTLIFGSKLEDAKIFKRWVTSEVLPSIRKTGSYSVVPQLSINESKLLHKQMKLLNETDLHYKVIDLIRTKFTNMIVVPGLGELQTTSHARLDAYNKGYVSGQPDILILNQTKEYNGFAIELKTPKGNGVVHDKQVEYLATLNDLKYKTLISCDYDEIVIELTKYFNDIRFSCKCCSKVFKTLNTLDGHMKMFHTKRN